jgi:antitoxin component of MazEF toxin-antitoxin module
VDDNRRVRTSWIAAVAVTSMLAFAGCSSSDDEPAAEPSASASASPSFDPPEGVTLTEGGTSLAVGQPATVVQQVGAEGSTAVTVTVTAIEPGSMDDFRFFSLDEATRKAAPYYVKATVRNDGPAGLGGAALPIFARDSTNTNTPANNIVGTFKPCPTATLPASFLPAATADVCLVYLVPEGRILTAIALQPGSTADAITWKP